HERRAVASGRPGGGSPGGAAVFGMPDLVERRIAVGRGEDDVGIARSDREMLKSSAVEPAPDRLPGASAVAAAEQTAWFRGEVQMCRVRGCLGEQTNLAAAGSQGYPALCRGDGGGKP